MENGQLKMENVTLEITTVLGEKIYSSELSGINFPISIDISGFSKGIYILAIKDKAMSLLRKIVVM